MLVFVTGASGGVGSAVVAELARAGHEVLGLARSERSAAIVSDLGATPVRGDLTDADALRTTATRADGVVHLAFGNDFSDIQRCIDEETVAVDAFASALAGTGKPLVIASGTPALPGRIATENDPTPVEGVMAGRARNAQRVLDLAADGIRSGLVRLPRCVHLRGAAYGFASMLIAAARRTGVSGFVGDGAQRWPAVNRLDAATLFRRLLEDGGPGAVAHAVGDEGVPMRRIAEVIGAELGLPTRPLPTESFGPLGEIFAVDQPAGNTLTRERFGWAPVHPGLLDDLAAGGYPG